MAIPLILSALGIGAGAYGAISGANAAQRTANAAERQAGLSAEEEARRRALADWITRMYIKPQTQRYMQMQQMFDPMRRGVMQYLMGNMQIPQQSPPPAASGNNWLMRGLYGGQTWQ